MIREALIRAREWVGNRLFPHVNNNQGLFRERLAELELAIENEGWERISGEATWEFNREFMCRLVSLSRVMFLKNPQIRRSVLVKCFYVWALGITIRAKDKQVQEVIDSFFDDPKNAVEIGTHQARMQREEDLEVTGNLFFIFFTNEVTGRVRVRTIDVEIVADIQCNPNDKKQPWFYRCTYSDGSKQFDAWRPDYNYRPIQQQASIEGIPIRWAEPIFHVKIGGLSTMRYGLPEYYSAMDWARSYKDFLEDWATIMRSYAKLAMKISGMRGPAGAAAAKSRLNTTVTPASPFERNPQNVAGGWFLTSQGVDVQAIRTAGATTSAEEGRPLKLMVASGAGLPETFYGDADVGNFATSQTLDRPTELMMVDRQKLWVYILRTIINFVLLQSAKAPGGPLRKAGVGFIDEPDTVEGEVLNEIQWPSEVSSFVDIQFPDILERNATDRTRAIVQAVTMNGKPIQGVIRSKRMITRWILRALGEDNVEDLVEQLYPEGVDDEIKDVEPVAPAIPQGGKGINAQGE